MPSVHAAQIYAPDMKEAVQRLEAAWNPMQARDALASLTTFANAAYGALKRKEQPESGCKGGAA